MKKKTGIVLIWIGIIFVVLGALSWLNIIPPSQTQATASIWDVLLKLLDLAPWPIVVGIILILFGIILSKSETKPAKSER